ncbi:MAG: SUMF1/EgtB/PvdO family nonheme iron enzyme, partial [Deltaproteobacteria bacterium]|nr:SUMF1/EgtB/PvdO family nonheme iron enzyme [Deltaproteobacteria bacterium]
MKYSYANAGGCLLALTVLAAVAGCKSAPPPPEGMIEIPKGEFIMGSNDVDKEAKAFQYGDRRPWYSNERPERKVTLDRFYIDRTEVTNQQYAEFAEKAGHRPPPHWGGNTPPEGLADHPVIFVNWSDADAFCNWKG